VAPGTLTGATGAAGPAAVGADETARLGVELVAPGPGALRSAGWVVV
jgi:hypothetical protein